MGLGASIGDRHSTAVNSNRWFNFPLESALSPILLPCTSFVYVDAIENWLLADYVWDWCPFSWQT